MMKIIDISWPIGLTMTQYKNKNSVNLERVHKEGGYVMEHSIMLNSHTGTHIDAPAHFIEGATTINHVPLNRFIGRCFVADMTHVSHHIDQYVLEGIPAQKGDIVIFKTRNSMNAWDEPFDPNFIYVEASAARYAVSREWKALGIDYLGIERNQPDHETHILLGAAEIPIIEGLRLAEVTEGFYFACILPLKIIGLEAAPARAILFEDLFPE